MKNLFWFILAISCVVLFFVLIFASLLGCAMLGFGGMLMIMYDDGNDISALTKDVVMTPISEQPTILHFVSDRELYRALHGKSDDELDTLFCRGSALFGSESAPERLAFPQEFPPDQMIVGRRHWPNSCRVDTRGNHLLTVIVYLRANRVDRIFLVDRGKVVRLKPQ